MAEKLNQVLPHNPLKDAGLLDEVKRLKGDKPWLQFELELLTAKYPDNKKLSEALAGIKAKVEQPQAPKSKAKPKPSTQVS